MKLYRKILQRLCRKEIKKIADQYPIKLDDLIYLYDYYAILSIDEETNAKSRMLGICLSTSNCLEKLNERT